MDSLSSDEEMPLRHRESRVNNKSYNCNTNGNNTNNSMYLHLLNTCCASGIVLYIVYASRHLKFTLKVGLGWTLPLRICVNSWPGRAYHGAAETFWLVERRDNTETETCMLFGHAGKEDRCGDRGRGCGPGVGSPRGMQVLPITWWEPSQAWEPTRGQQGSEGPWSTYRFKPGPARTGVMPRSAGGQQGVGEKEWTG